jgi:hypothetical protein
LTRKRNLGIRQAYADSFDVAGPLTAAIQADQPVRFRSVVSRKERWVLTLLVLLNLVTGVGFIGWLLLPWHVPGWSGGLSGVPLVAALVGFCLVVAVELMRLAQNAAMWVFAFHAKDPVPVEPPVGLRVALLTTIVPSSEPLDIAERTLRKMLQIAYLGQVDVWILDEGDDPRVKALARRLGVRHFSRKGRPEYNQPAGEFRARTKAGNHNAWRAEHEREYDVVAQMDPDHVPLPCFLQRTLGYFRDPDVAFVVAPQVYGNYVGAVTKAAESQQYLFHALIQRAGNRYRAPMLVGTNNVVRIAALLQIGGLYDSITEDMATGFELHRRRNPGTGRHWTSVYTPDVLAKGEGPASWTDFFTQQTRWSRGTYETLLKQYWKAPFGMPPGRLLSYTLMLVYYPMTAVNWLLGVLSSVLFLWFGASGTQVSSSVWLMLYSDAAALQVGLYMWNRRHNVSPHEPEGSGGLAGMVMSALAAPVYARSLMAALLRRPSRFVVTPKGGTSSTDRLGAFRVHLTWAALLAVSICASLPLRHSQVAMRIWACLALAVCLAPTAVWCGARLRVRRFRPPAVAIAAEPRSQQAALVTGGTPSGGG